MIYVYRRSLFTKVSNQRSLIKIENTNSIALGRFELPSSAPKADMLGHYTTGLYF